MKKAGTTRVPALSKEVQLCSAKSWIMITVSYFGTLGITASLYRLIFEQPVDRNWDASGLFIGSFLLVVPYILAGIYARNVFAKAVVGAFWVSAVPVISERILIYGIGSSLVASGGDGSMDGVTTMMFIRGEAASFYTLSYILLGAFSILLAMMISRRAALQR